MIDLHLNRQLRRYSESSSDLIVPEDQTSLVIDGQSLPEKIAIARHFSGVNLTRAGRGQHCRTCRARERTRGWPVDRSSRSSRMEGATPVPPLAQPLIARRPVSLNAMETREEKIFRALPNLPTRSCHLEEGFQRRRFSGIFDTTDL